MPGPEYVVAVDLGGTLTKIGYAAADGSLTGAFRMATELTEDGSVAPEWLAAAMTDAAANRDGRCVGFGVAVPGVIDTVRGMVRAAPNVGWRDVALQDRLEDRLGWPGAVGHDVRAGGLAEWRQGRGVGSQNMLFLSLGTGIAGAMVVDGRLLEADGYAGELGHLRVSAGGDHRCACGSFGCLETVGSAAGVARSYVRLTGTAADAYQVAIRARLGDQAAQQAFAVAAAGLVEALAAYVAIVAPELVIIGGGLSGASDLLLPDIGPSLGDRLSFHRVPELAVAALGPDAGVIGAGLVGWDRVRAERDGPG